MLKRPIYYCTNFEFSSEPYPSKDPEDYMGEFIEKYYIESTDIRDDKKHIDDFESHVPYFMEELENVEDYLNIEDYGSAIYRKVEGPSYEDYKRAYAELIEMGKPEESITASTLREYLKDLKPEDKKGKKF